MRIKFFRNTHDKNGDYRGDEAFGEIDHDRELFFGVHTLKSNVGMTLEEVFKETWNMLYGGALDGFFDPKDPRFTIEGHLKALSYMIEKGLVRAEILVT